MARNYQVGLIIKGNAKGGVTAVKATKDELEKLNAKQRSFRGEVSKSNNYIGQMTNQFGLLKGSIVGTFASLASVAGGKQFISDFAEQEKAVALLDASIASMGRTTDGLSTKLQNLAAEIQQEGIIGDEVLIKGQSFLTTYKDITDDLLPRTTRIMADLTAKMGGDAVRAANLLGKASMGLTGALSIAGISLSDATKKSKDFEMILSEIEEQVGGTNKALGDASTSGFTQFGNALGDYRENVGEILTIGLGEHFREWSHGLAISEENIDSIGEAIGQAINVLIPVIATFSKMLMVGGVLYLGIKANAAITPFLTKQLFALRMAYIAGVGPVTLFNTSVKAMIASTKAAIVQTGLLKSALAFLGGPVGIAMVAGYALYEMGSNMDSAKSAAEQLEEAIGKTTKSIEEMTLAEQRATLAEYDKLIQDKIQKIKELKIVVDENRELSNNSAGKNSSTAYGIKSYTANEGIKLETEELENLKNAYSEVQGAIFDAGIAGIQWTKRIENGNEIINSGIVELSSSTQNLLDRLDPITAKTNQHKSEMLELKEAYSSGGLTLNEYNKYVKLLTDEFKKNSASKKQEVSANQKLIASLGQEIGLLRMSAKEKAVYTQISKLSADASQDEINAVNSLSEALYEQQQLKADNDFYDELLGAAGDFADSWSSASNVIVDAFGTIGQQLDKLGKQNKEFAQSQEKIAKDKLKYADDPKMLAKVEAAEKSLAGTRTSAHLASYASITGAAADMFGEETKGRQALQMASNIFTAMEVANSLVRGGAYAVEAVAAAFAAPWPIGFASGAAMIAIMAGLGFAVGGGGGGGGNGTGAAGTALGGEVSESVDNSVLILTEIAIAQLAELRGLRSDLSQVNNQAYGLYRDLLNVDPGHDEIKNSTERQLENSFDGLNGGFVLDAPFTESLAQIFDSVDSTIGEAISVLGLNTQTNLDSFVFDIGKISFDDLDPEAAEKRLNQILSAQSDLMVESIVPWITEYQKIGEGALETLARVSKEQAIFNDALENMGMSLSHLSATMQIDVAQSIIDLTGGIDKFTDLTSDFFDNFYSEAEQFDILSRSVTEAVESLGLSMFENEEQYRNLVESIDVTTESGQQLYASLLELSPALGEYYKALEEQKLAAEEAAAAEQELALARTDFIQGFADELAQMDMSAAEIQFDDLRREYEADLAEAEALNVDTTLMQAFYARKQQEIWESALADLTTSHQQSVDKLTAEHDKWISSLTTVNASLATNILNIRRSFDGWDEVSYQQGQVDDFRGQLGEGTAEQQLDTIAKLNDALWNKYQAEIDHNNRLSELDDERYQTEIDNYNQLLDIVNNLQVAANNLQFGSLSPLSTGNQFDLAQTQFTQLLASVQGGDLEAASQLQASGESYLSLASDYYGGTASSQYQAIFDQVTNGFNSIGAGSAPDVPAAVLQYQQDDLRLSEDMLAEMAGLRELTAGLEVEEQQTLEESLSLLNEEFSTQTAALEAALLVQTNGMATAFESSINNLPAPPPVVVNVPAPVVNITQPVNNTGTGLSPQPPSNDIPGTSLPNGATQEQVAELIDIGQRQLASNEALEIRQAEQGSRRYLP